MGSLSDLQSLPGGTGWADDSPSSHGGVKAATTVTMIAEDADAGSAAPTAPPGSGYLPPVTLQTEQQCHSDKLDTQLGH